MGIIPTNYQEIASRSYIGQRVSKKLTEYVENPRLTVTDDAIYDPIVVIERPDSVDVTVMSLPLQKPTNQQIADKPLKKKRVIRLKPIKPKKRVPFCFYTEHPIFIGETCNCCKEILTYWHEDDRHKFCGHCMVYLGKEDDHTKGRDFGISKELENWLKPS